ncbi:MAG TPA: hypothetical protein VH374_09300 [Polyangia bacterium]|nr:hypothetical protein [Polyangia bacterium]
MHRERRPKKYGYGFVAGLCALTAMAALVGCGDSHLGAYYDGGRHDGGLDSVEVRRDTNTTVDAGPPPAVGPGSVLLVPGNARLVGHGKDSCSNQSPATSDRWCAFSRPSSFLGLSDLWVINVTQALAGKTIACDGNDANCLRLSSNVFDGDLTMHGFGGDTLIYYADNLGDSMNFIGTVFAWRPEWVVPRALTSQTGLTCQAHPTAQSVICIENPVTDATTQNFMLDLTGGTLGPTNNGPVPKLDTVLYSAPNDPTNITKFQAGFTPAGDVALWSARTTPTGPEILNSQTLNDASTRQVVAQDVAHWQVSNDSSSWYWLKSFNYSTTGADSGTLQVAPYPAGTPATVVLTGVGEYTAVGSKSVVVRAGLTQGAGTLKLIGDITDVAGTSKTFDTGVLATWDMSADGTTVLYSKTNTGSLYDMYLGSVTKAMPCPLATTAVALGFGHLAPNTLTAAWVKAINQNDTGAYYTTFDKCVSNQFGINIVTFDAVGDQGYVYEDDGDATLPIGTLRYNQIVNGVLSATGAQVQTNASATVSLLWPAHSAVVYSINANNATDGVYVNAMLPFTETVPPPGADGGTETGTDSPAADTASPSDAGAADAAETATDTAASDTGSGG